MTMIYEYGSSKTQTSTGKKWEGNVIAVPKGWKTGVEYEIALEDGTKLKALAVDSTGGDSFSVPRGGELAKLVGKQKCEVKPSAPVLTAEKIDKVVGKFAMPDNLELSGFGGIDVTAQSSGNVNVTYAGQASAKYSFDENDYLRAGVSFRPYRLDNGDYSLARPFITTANYTHVEGDFSYQFGVPDLLLGNSAYNTIGKNPCGCSGNAPPGKTASMAGLHLAGNLVETNVLGAAATYANDNTSVTLGVGSVLQSDIFNQGNFAAYTSAYYDLNDKTRLIGNAAVSRNQQSYNLGVQRWITEDFQLRLNAGVDKGEIDRKRLDLLGMIYANDRNTFSAGASYINDGRDKFEGAVTWTNALDSKGNWLLNARAASDFAKDHNLSLGFMRKF